MKKLQLQQQYNDVMAQAISESGKFLFIGTIFGDILVQDLNDFEETENPRRKLDIYPQPENTSINSLITCRNFLIVGTIGVIYGLRWDEEKRQLAKKQCWEIKIPMNVDAFEVPDVNYLWLQAASDTLYAGCGDNNIYKISLEDGRIARDFRGHTDFLHCVTGGNYDSTDSRLYSASEDGTVRIWSEQQKDSIASIEPGKHANLVRPEFGKWIGAVAVNSDWLICGGGPKFSIWHLRSMDFIRDYPFPGKVHVCDFVEDDVFVAGEHNHAEFYTMNGELRANIPLEHTAVYSQVWQLEPIKFMSIGGYSNKLHILNDFRFLDSKIEMYGNTK